MAKKKSTTIEDANTEMLLVGCFYINPDLFLDYGDLIKSKYDFYHNTAKFLYNSIYEMYHYYNYTNDSMDEVKINYYMNKDKKRKEKYEKINGYEIVEKITKIADLNEFENYYNNVKKLSLLRELERKGFPSQKILENKKYEKMTPEELIQSMEYQINTIGTVIGGVQESVKLGANALKQYKEWKINPDIGVEIPYFVLNHLIRGWRKKKINLTGLHSGQGKSRFISKIASYIGLKGKTPLLLCVNEQDQEEWTGMLISSVVNNPEFGFNANINETKIVTGVCNEKEDKICQKAAKWIEENTNIYFIYLNRYDMYTLKRQIKRHKIMGCDYFIYDTLKSPDYDWQSFVKTANTLKDISNELDMGGWATFQLTDDSLFNELLTSQAIASGKHIKHISDGLTMARPLFEEEYDKYEIINPFLEEAGWGEEIQFLDKSKKYYVMFLDKNRGGEDKHKIVYEVDKGRNYWKEIGLLVDGTNEKEYKKLSKEKKKLKTKKEVKKLKEEFGIQE